MNGDNQYQAGWHPGAPLPPTFHPPGPGPQFDPRDMMIMQLHGQISQLSAQVMQLSTSVTMSYQQVAAQNQAIANARAALLNEAVTSDTRVSGALSALPAG